MFHRKARYVKEGSDEDEKDRSQDSEGVILKIK